MSVDAGGAVVGGPAESNDAAAGSQVDSTNTDTGSGDSDNGGTGYNPAWNNLMEKLPSALHPMITPELKSWDEKFQQQLQQVHSQYEPYKPFLDNQVSPEALQQAYDLFELINTNPQLVYEQMQSFYGFGGQGQEENNTQGQPQGDEPFDFNNPEADITQHPQFKALAENQQALAQFFVQQQEAEKLAAAEKQIDAELATVKEQYPNLDELLIFQTATGGNMTLTQAAQMLNHQYEQMLQQSRQPAPRVFSATGGVPAQQPVDPAKLDAKGTKSLVADILARSHQE